MTDAPSLDIAIAVLTGLVNKQLVAAIGNLGGKAVGISGVDDKLLEAYISDPKLGLVGKIKTVHGIIDTPAFMPVGTQGTVKSVFVEDIFRLHESLSLLLRPNDVVLTLGAGNIGQVARGLADALDSPTVGINK